MKLSGRDIAKELEALQRCGDTPFTLVMKYESTTEEKYVKRGTLFAFECKPGTLLDAARNGRSISQALPREFLMSAGGASGSMSAWMNKEERQEAMAALWEARRNSPRIDELDELQVPSSWNVSTPREPRPLVVGVSAGRNEQQYSSRPLERAPASWLLLRVPIKGEKSMIRRSRVHLELIREALELVLDIPFLILALAVFAAGWRSIELIRQIKSRPSLHAVRLSILWQFWNAAIDLPFVFAFPLFGMSLWLTLILTNPLVGSRLFSSFSLDVLTQPALPLWAASLVLALSCWRIVPLSFDICAARNAKQRRSAVAKQLLLLLLDPLALCAGLVVLCGLYRIPSVWHSLASKNGEAAVRTCRSAHDGKEPRVRTWQDVTIPHRMLVAAAASQLLDLPFVILGGIVTLSGYRASSLWTTLLVDWPLSDTMRDELFAVSSLACALCGVEKQRQTTLGGPHGRGKPLSLDVSAAELLPLDCLMLITSYSSDVRTLCRIESVSLTWYNALRVHHKSQVRTQWTALFIRVWRSSFVHNNDDDAQRQVLRAGGASSRHSSRTLEAAIADASFSPKRAYAEVRKRQLSAQKRGARRRAALSLCRFSTWWFGSTRRGAILYHFVSMLCDLPFVLLALPLLIFFWRLPAVMMQAQEYAGLAAPYRSTSLIARIFSSRSSAVGTRHTDFGMLRYVILSHAFLLPFDVPFLIIGAVLRLAHSLIGCTLSDAIDPNFLGSMEELYPDDMLPVCGGLLSLTLSNWRPHLWVVKQLLTVMLHALHLVLGGLLLISWRRRIFLHGVADAAGKRADLRRLVLLQAVWLMADVMCLPLFLVLCLTAWVSEMIFPLLLILELALPLLVKSSPTWSFLLLYAGF